MAKVACGNHSSQFLDKRETAPVNVIVWYPKEDSSAKNPDQPNEDQVNGYDVVQNARHNQDQDSRKQGKERSGQGVMNRHCSTMGLGQQRQRDDQDRQR